MSKRVLKICGLEWVNASRDKRELSVCRELGLDVLVMAKGKPGDRFKEDEVDGFPVMRFSSRPIKWLPRLLNRVVSLFLWAHDARKLKPDIITGHNLVGLGIGWISTWFQAKEKKPALVYDSHEFEIGRSEKRSGLATWLITHLERFLMNKCAFSIMVNDNIADEVQRIHGLKTRPVVVRSTPERWTLDDEAILNQRKKICAELGIPCDSFIIMYHGMLMPQRNVEALLDAVARNDNVYGLIVGDSAPSSFGDVLKEYAEKLGIRDRVYFHPAVDMIELPNYIAAASVGLILHKKYASNAEYSLPNKFFENIQGLTPVISTNTAVLDRYIKEYGIGISVDITNDEDVDNAIRKLQNDSDYYLQCKKNLAIAKEKLCWEKEKTQLANAYQKIIKG